MTSFFYDVNLHSRAVETLGSAYSPPILTVLVKFEPLNVSSHREDPKRQLLTSRRVFGVTVHQNPPTGHFSRRLNGAITHQKQQI